MNDLIALYAGNCLRIFILIVGGIPFVFWMSKLLARLSSKHVSQHIAVLLRKFMLYGGLLFLLIITLQELGFNVAALLGAAGIFGVAIGFASQAAVSNIISGFFLLFEGSFSVGDIIKSGDILGSVESIDLLSVYVRTSDNKLIRLPNEALLKQSLSNLTYYPVKRIDCVVSMPYTIDVEDAKNQIQQVIASNSLFLKEPAAVVTVNKLAMHDFDTEIRTFLMVRVCVATEKFLSAPAILMQHLKDQFDKEDVVISIVQSNN